MRSGFSDSPASREPTRQRVATKIIQWRNWRLAVKLGAVVLVPVTFALTLGVLQIRSQVDQANEYARLDAVVTAASTVRSAATALQEERTRAAEFAGGGRVSPAALRDQFTRTDQAYANSTPALNVESQFGTAAVTARKEFKDNFAALPALRQQVVGSTLPPSEAINRYDAIIRSTLALDRALLGEISSPKLAAIATTRHELARMSSEMRLQQAWVAIGLLRSEFTPQSLVELGASETRRLTSAEDFRAAAPRNLRDEYDQLHAVPVFTAHEEALWDALNDGSSSQRASTPEQLAVSSRQWEGQSEAALASIRTLQERLDTQLHQTTFRLQDTASNLAGLQSVILLSALLFAGFIVVLVARQLLGSLNALRRSALDTANTRLPQTVAEVRAGNTSPLAALEQVPVNTTEEFGQLARAFDAVQKQAVTLAAEQAELRKSYSDSFVNVSRRSQSLLERQLRLFEQLERDEEDPDQLATLFQLDHLATRMRRNNENLMVLSGTDLTRRFTKPATPADLVRAAISEIEHYPRVVVQPLPDVRIVGYVANDLVRLLAELLDNAANFSSPQESVAVSGYRRGDGSIGIDILDRGIGMGEDELATANQRLATDGELELSTSRRMGLFVVGRLAARHGIHVHLHTGPDAVGIRASVSLQAELVMETPGKPAPHANGLPGGRDAAVTQPDPSMEDTIVQKIDWDAVTQRTQHGPMPTRNGHRASGAKKLENKEGFPPPRRDSHTNGRHVPASEQNGGGQRDGTKPTPIFDNLASAWFQASRISPNGTTTPDATEEVRWPPRFMDDGKGTELPQRAERLPSANEPPSAEPAPSRPVDESSDQETTNWTFESDDARIRAEQVSATKPTDYTAVGLPIRVPRANLVAGSAAEGATSDGDRPHRDPARARNRLSRFQQGLREGRRTDAQPASPQESPLSPSDNSDIGTDWTLPDNAIAQRTESAAHRPPDEYTAAGLPKRTPRAQLTPESAGTNTHSSSQRDADLMRGRLSSFQRGITEGKHSLHSSADESVDGE